jgi:hypothetical protein
LLLLCRIGLGRNRVDQFRVRVVLEAGEVVLGRVKGADGGACEVEMTAATTLASAAPVSPVVKRAMSSRRDIAMLIDMAASLRSAVGMESPRNRRESGQCDLERSVVANRWCAFKTGRRSHVASVASEGQARDTQSARNLNAFSANDGVPAAMLAWLTGETW